jgi:hypothetical protein
MPAVFVNGNPRERRDLGAPGAAREAPGKPPADGPESMTKPVPETPPGQLR